MLTSLGSLAMVFTELTTSVCPNRHSPGVHTHAYPGQWDDLVSFTPWLFDWIFLIAAGTLSAPRELRPVWVRKLLYLWDSENKPEELHMAPGKIGLALRTKYGTGM